MSASQRNRFPGRCTLCRAPVAAGAGTKRRRYGRWHVTHDACPAGEQLTQQRDLEETACGLVAPEGDCERQPFESHQETTNHEH